MIIPASVTDSIAAAGIDVSNDWLSSSVPVWNSDYSAILSQPISIAATPLADMRFLSVTTATITIRVSSAPLSLVSWSGIATLVADGTTGGPTTFPVHNTLTGRDATDAHPLASITGLVDALDEKAPAFASDGARLFWATPEAAPGLPSLRHVTYADLTGAGLAVQNNGTYVDMYGDGVSTRNSTTRSVGISRDGRFTLLNASTNVTFAIANASVIDAYSNRVNLSQKLQFGGVDAISLTRDADFSTLKVGSLSGTLIGTAGNVSALSGTGLVLGNGTTIPQSTFVTSGSYLPLAGGTMDNDALVTFNSTASNWEPSAITITRPFISGGQTQDAGIDITTGNGHGLRIALQSGNFYSGLQVNNASSEFAVELLLSGSGAKSLYAAGSVLIDGAMDARAGVDISTGLSFRVAGDAVVGTRKTGWTAATGTATRTAFATSTVTLPQLAERFKALLDDLISHGLIGA